MDRGTRDRLTAAGREFMAAEPWESLSPAHLVGIRDGESGRIACAMLLAQGRDERSLFLAVGPEAFEAFALSGREIARSWDLAGELEGFVFSTISRRDSVSEGDPWERLGTWQGLLLGACASPPGDGWGPPSDEQALFLARALRALARWAGPECKNSFLAPPPGFPVLALSGRERLEIRESFESIRPPQLLPAPLLVRPEIRDAIPSVATVDAYFLHFLPCPRREGGEPSQYLVLCDHARRRILAAERIPQDRLESRGGEVLFEALAGDLQCSAPPPRPRRIVTDCRPVYEHAREAVEGLGIRFVCERRIPSHRDFAREAGIEVALTHERQEEYERRAGRPRRRGAP